MGVQETGDDENKGTKNKYRRMDSELTDYGNNDPEVVQYNQTQRQRSKRTRKYVFACAVFASLNNVLLGYGKNPKRLFVLILKLMVQCLFSTSNHLLCI